MPFPFPAEKVFLAAFSAFFGKVDGWGRRRGRKKEKKEKNHTTTDGGKEKRRRSGKVVKKKKGELTILHHLPNSLTFFWMIP